MLAADPRPVVELRRGKEEPGPEPVTSYPPRQIEQVQDQNAGGKLVLLVIEDAVTRQMYRTALEFWGYRVTARPDSTSGLRSATADVPDLAVVEAELPVIDGFTFLRMFKATPAFARARLIMFGQDATGELRARSRGEGCDLFLPFPLSPRRLIVEVASVLGDPLPQSAA